MKVGSMLSVVLTSMFRLAAECKSPPGLLALHLQVGTEG